MPNFISLRNALAVVSLVCIFAFNSFAQAPAKQAEPNYEVVLQVLSASNSAGGEAAPQTLSGVVKRLKTMYSFSNYRIDATYFQRVANDGSLEFKGVLGGANQDAFAPVFSEFSFGRLLNSSDADGRGAVSIQNFRFGQRVPIKTASLNGENGKSNPVINYEPVGLTMRQVGVPLGAPTILGNLSGAKPDELSFLILTVRLADN